MKALDEPILPGAGRFDVDRLDLVLGQPALDFFGNELGAIVAAQVLWSAMFGDGLAHPFEHIGTFQGAVGPQHVALAGVLIQNGQHPQGSAPRRRIRDEVPGPDMSTMLRLRRKPCGSASAHDLAFGRRHPQAPGSAQLLHVPLADGPAFPAQQRRDPAVAIPGMLL